MSWQSGIAEQIEAFRRALIVSEASRTFAGNPCVTENTKANNNETEGGNEVKGMSCEQTEREEATFWVTRIAPGAAECKNRECTSEAEYEISGLRCVSEHGSDSMETKAVVTFVCPYHFTDFSEQEQEFRVYSLPGYKREAVQ